MGTSALLQALAADEDETWLNLWDGARVPKGIVTAGDNNLLAELCGGLSSVRSDNPSLKTRDEWQKENPRKWGVHWRREGISGERVVSAERRVGRNEYTSLRLIQEVATEAAQ